MAALDATSSRCNELEERLKSVDSEIQEWKDKYEALQDDINEKLQVGAPAGLER